MEPHMRKGLEHAERTMSQQDGDVDEESIQRNVDKMMEVNPYKLEYEQAHQELQMSIKGEL